MENDTKIIVLVGLMGAGKTRVGAELAKLLGRPFVDSDKEIARAAGMPIPDIFDMYGEPAFRDGEHKVIQRLLQGPPIVLATGGGAFIQPAIHDLIKSQGISIWLKANLDILVERTARRDTRPLLRGGDPREILAGLMAVREPIYARADIVVTSDGCSPKDMARRVQKKLEEYKAGKGAQS